MVTDNFQTCFYYLFQWDLAQDSHVKAAKGMHNGEHIRAFKVVNAWYGHVYVSKSVSDNNFGSSSNTYDGVTKLTF